MGYLFRIYKEQRSFGRKVQYDKLLWRLLAEGRPALKETYDLGVAYIEGAATYYLAEQVKARRKAAFVHIDYQKAGYTLQMDRGCYDKIDRIFVVSDEVGTRFGCVYPQYKDKICLFRNLHNREEILTKAQDRGFDDDYKGTRLLTVGRLHYQKGYDIAVRILAKLRNDGYEVRWYVIGEGEERAELLKLARMHGVEESFLLLGARENPYPFIKQADIYVQATRFEGKSIAIEEAQILGKAILASNCTGNTEQIISGYDGSLVELSVDAVTDGLKYLLDNPSVRKEYEDHVLQKKLEFFEDLDNLLELINS